MEWEVIPMIPGFFGSLVAIYIASWLTKEEAMQTA